MERTTKNQRQRAGIEGEAPEKRQGRVLSGGKETRSV